MKKTSTFVLVLIVLAFLFTNVALAGDSLSFSISCTIPAIPGVNAPLIEEEKTQAKQDTPIQAKSEPQKETQTQAPTMILQDTQEEKINSEGQNSLVIVKTIYSR